MADMIRESIVNYHNQHFGEAIESVHVSGAYRELSDLALCQDQEWCPIHGSQSKSSGYFFEFDMTSMDLESLKIDVFHDVLCISASPQGGLIDALAFHGDGREFGLHQCLHLPVGADSNAVSAYIKESTLKVWVPRNHPL
ncbi:MAG TPA: Hsp20/alpha crystallin family protein [Bdellovibrionota bacterium]|nr:Hsp20/alpha crystallin family protein [Bdellovibrionota bacterium]